MKSGLQIFETTRVQEVADQGFELVRIDHQKADNERIAREVAEIEAVGLIPYVILRSPDQLDAVPEGRMVEVGNEPDLEKHNWSSPAVYRVTVDAFIARSNGRHRIFVGAISNLNDRGFNYLRAIRVGELPADVGVSVHRYPDGHSPTNGQRKGGLRGAWGARYTRDEEVATLLRIIGTRALGLSEIGYNRAGWTDEEIAQNMAWERDFFSRHNFEFAVAYQINSGPGDPTDIHESYGFRREDGTWSPVTQAWTS